MRETQFIEQNAEKWRDFEQVLQLSDPTPGRLSELYIQITDDLSYARTYYPHRSVTVYLNELAQHIYLRIYKGKRSQKHRLISFWTKELPLLLYHNRINLLISTAVFLLSLAIGVISCAMDENFAQVILGDSYIQMTEENIASGDPMAVYKKRGALGMSLAITANNLRVAFLTFVFGAFFSIGSIGILLRNGVMVGCFQWFFVERGLFRESFLAIWMHGTLEISAIILAGAAGITLGRGLVFPGTLPRMRAFQLTARQGIKIMIGIAPIIILAGFIEGFVTRLTEVPDPVRALFILGCAVFVGWYYVWYPRRVAQGRTLSFQREMPLYPGRPPDIPLSDLRKAGSRLGDTLQWMLSQEFKLFRYIGLTSFMFVWAVNLMNEEVSSSLLGIPTSPIGVFTHINTIFTIGLEDPVMLAIIVACWTMVLDYVASLLPTKDGIRRANYGRRLLWMSPVAIAITVVFLIPEVNPVFPLLLIVPVVMMYAAVLLQGQDSVGQALRTTLRMLRMRGYTRLLSLQALFLGIAMVLLLLLFSSLSLFFLDMLSWVIPGDQDTLNTWGNSIVLWLLFTVILYLGVMSFVGMYLQLFTIREINDAERLRERISRIDLRRTIRGLEREHD